MKKTVRILSMVLVAAILCVAFASCGNKLSGEYSTNVLLVGDVSFDFSGSKVTITIKAIGAVLASVEGKYKIKDDQITFEFESDKEEVKKYNGTFDFAETEKGIKIGIVEYKKAEK